VNRNEGCDVSLEFRRRSVDTALQLLARQFGKPALDRLMQEADVGVEWTCQCGRRASQALIFGILGVA
jgi:hypothetical protein